MSILLYLGIFFAGVVIGYAIRHALFNMQSFDGVMRVAKEEEKTVYSLELHEDPEMLKYKDEVIFKVLPSSTIDSIRE